LFPVDHCVHIGRFITERNDNIALAWAHIGSFLASVDELISFFFFVVTLGSGVHIERNAISYRVNIKLFGPSGSFLENMR